MNLQIAIIGYVVAGTAFLILIVWALFVWRGRARGSALLAALFISAIWSFLFAYSGIRGASPGFSILVYELVHDLTWLVFLGLLLGHGAADRSNKMVRRGGVLLVIGLLLAGIGVQIVDLGVRSGVIYGQIIVFGSIASSLFALIGIEQIYRNSRPLQRRVLKGFCIGLGGIFAFDLLLYSAAVAGGDFGAMFWGVRGYVVAICIPVMAVSVKRVPSWNRGMFLSRKVVFYSTTMVAAGIYLTVVGFAGYYIKEVGKDWGATMQIVFLAASVLFFILLVLSEQIRGRVRVFMSKHFFEQNYDYRAEWLRLIHTLTSSVDDLPLRKRAIKALAEILRSPFGYLWLKNDSGKSFRSVASWNVQPGRGAIPVDNELFTYLESKSWILDIDEVRSDPTKYRTLNIATVSDEIAAMRYVIPLLHASDLIGFVTLSAPEVPIALTFEDHDLLKTAGQQIASYLAQETTMEQLAEGRQFEAYNRLTAYVMHDLKNAVAQQSMVVRNAEKHRRNPEFVDDAIETIKGSVDRMNRVLRQLKQNAFDQSNEKVDVSKIVMQAESQCSDREPVPVASAHDSPAIVVGNPDRLLMALCHAIRNAQDATPADGQITIGLEHNATDCEIRISDTGEGMDEQFIRDRFFRPFDSTKGAEGMGIGAYQIREAARTFGGDVEVASDTGKGTEVTLRLPLFEGSDR